MILKIKKPSDLPYSEVTPERIYRSRRAFLMTATGAIGAAVAAASAWAWVRSGSGALLAQAPDLKSTKNAKYTASDKPNSFEQITHYNNFYEFGKEKSD